MEENVKKVYFAEWSLKNEHNTIHVREFEWHDDAITCAHIILETFGIEELQLLQVREKYIEI